MTLIISLSGFRGSGKDTIAKYLVQQYGFRQLAFADRLKQICSKEYNVPRHHFDDHEFKDKRAAKHRLTPRQMCLKVADKERAKDPLVFIRPIIEEILNNPYQNFIVSDCRLKNEMEQFYKHFGINYVSIYVQRFDKSSLNHPTENEIGFEHCNFTLQNTEDFESTVESIEKIMAAILPKINYLSA